MPEMMVQDSLHATAAPRPTASSRDFEVVLHIGHVKTASTWLEETIFANPDSGFVVPCEDAAARAVAAFITVNSYCDDPRWARSLFAEGLERCARGPGVPVIAQEILCGHPLGRLYTGRYIADRIHAAFPRAKILIGIREQKALAISLYREYIQGYDSGVFPLEVFLGRGDEPLGYTPILYPDFLEFDRVVGYYQTLYGRENVLVLPLEHLQHDPQGYVRSVLEFCQCSGRLDRLEKPRKVGLSAAALAIRRRFNPWIPPNPLLPQPATRAQRTVDMMVRAVDRVMPPSWSAPLERRWKEITARRYEGLFRDSNRRLAAMTGLDLAGLGYEV
jgi:hypothetical protein